MLSQVPRRNINNTAPSLECRKLTFLRSYIVYWWKSALARVGNWQEAHFFLPPNALGWFHASLDVKHGISKCYFNGLLPLWHAEAKKILDEDYQIDLVNLNHLDHSGWHVAYESAYNRVSRAEIKRKYGVDVVELCLIKAESNFRNNHQLQVPKQGQLTA